YRSIQEENIPENSKNFKKSNLQRLLEVQLTTPINREVPSTGRWSVGRQRPSIANLSIIPLSWHQAEGPRMEDGDFAPAGQRDGATVRSVQPRPIDTFGRGHMHGNGLVCGLALHRANQEQCCSR